jgi:hypothetical protein
MIARSEDSIIKKVLIVLAISTNTKTMEEQKTNIWKIILGASLTPLVISLYFIDRMICVPCFWIEAVTLRDFLDRVIFIQFALWRVGAVLVGLFLFWTLSLIL